MLLYKGEQTFESPSSLLRLHFGYCVGCLVQWPQNPHMIFIERRENAIVKHCHIAHRVNTPCNFVKNNSLLWEMYLFTVANFVPTRAICGYLFVPVETQRSEIWAS